MKVLLAAAGLTLFAGGAQAGLIPIGSSLTFGGTNLPGACTDTTCSDTTTFGGTTLIDGGALSLTTSQVASGSSEWDVFSITTTGGGPVAGDINAYWNIVMDYQLSVPVDFIAVVDQWTVNGTPVSPLTGNIGGICCATASNPSPLSGAAYYNSGFSAPLPAGTESDWNQIFVDPYSFVAVGGINPSTANGFNFGLEFTPQTPVPEPASLAIFGAALAGLGAIRRRRRKTG